MLWAPSYDDARESEDKAHAVLTLPLDEAHIQWLALRSNPEVPKLWGATPGRRCSWSSVGGGGQIFI
jgi:hypothetical protein